MNVGDERSHSLWMDVDVAPGTSKLTQDAEKRYRGGRGRVSPASRPPMSSPDKGRRSLCWIAA